jgi:Uma2 family endonuclease
MASTPTDLLTWEAFVQIPDDAMHRELIDGELIVLPPPILRHTTIAMNAAKALLPLDVPAVGRVMVEAGYKLTDRPPTWIQPDVSVLSTARFNDVDADGYFQGSPELAIEVVSPSETARDLKRKVALFLAHGCLAVWVIDPRTEHVKVYLPGGTTFTKTLQETLTTPDPLGPFEIPVASLFEK